MKNSAESSATDHIPSLRSAAAARRIGLSRDLLNDLAIDGTIPFYQLGYSKSRRYTEADLAAYLEAHRSPARL
jgi:excisionase family DNA binding protein